jgi:hypothetical protein
VLETTMSLVVGRWQNPERDTVVESHVCAEDAQTWGTRQATDSSCVSAPPRNDESVGRIPFQASARVKDHEVPFDRLRAGFSTPFGYRLTTLRMTALCTEPRLTCQKAHANLGHPGGRHSCAECGKEDPC